jgi:tRNA A-37 threonylcarbamoyl transferase component Bud32
MTGPVVTPGLEGAAGGTAAEFDVVDRGQYGIESELARGGMGKILRAVDRRHGRSVAIKQLLSDTPALRARFRREALITARLQHPGIVPVYEAGRWPSGEPFFAMKMVEGRSLDAVIAERPELARRMALLPNVIAVAEAIAYAHERRVIHRDLKPANVLVGAFGETVVIDWGLAKDLTQADEPAEAGAAVDAGAAPSSLQATGIVALDEVPQGLPASGDGLTIAGHAMGTPAYMAPEQARGEAVDQRIDVYALGGMLYHLLTGKMPYADSKSTDGGALLRKVLEEPPTPAAALVPDAPRDLVAIVAKAMARKPEERYPSAVQLVEDLRRFETGQLVSVRAYSSAELLRRWLRRNRLAVGFAAVLIAVLAVGGTIAITRVIDERNKAEAALAAAETERARAEEQSRIAAAERAAAERDRERAEQSEQEALAAGKQAAASAQALVEGWVQSRFADSIRGCYRRSGGKGARYASLLIEVDDKRGIGEASAVHAFGSSADECIVAASKQWSFPPGTRPGEYSLSLVGDGKGDVQIGFAASDVDSIRRTMQRDYLARLAQCYTELRRQSPKAGGKVELTLTTDQDGKGKVSAISAFDDRLGRCIVDEVDRWVFAPPRDEDGKPTTVSLQRTDLLEPPAAASGTGSSGRSGTYVMRKGTGDYSSGLTGSAPPAVNLGSANASGDLDKTTIRRYIRQRLAQIQYCYEKELLANPDLAGTVATRFTITAEGKVTSVSATGMDGTSVPDCVAGVVASITFPKPAGGGVVQVAYPFSFRPAAAD